jgi:3'-5' exoribonuclease
MTDRTFIEDMGPNQLVAGLFAIQNAQLGLTRQGKPYLKCLIADRTGRLAARMWSASESLVESLPTDGFVRIEGQTQPYQGQLQVIIQQIAAAKPTPEDLPDLLPSTENDVEQMFEQVSGILRSLEHADIRALVETYLQDSKLMAAFKEAPAAVTLHHAYLGGLLEHTLNLLKHAEAILPHHPLLSRDLVLTGLFLHDLGKCAELNWRSGFGYSDDGQLVGHLARGVIWLEQKALICAKAGHEIPRHTLMVLEHIILSHHGKPEYGAAKTPSTPEALFVSLLDNFEAKLHMAETATRGKKPSPAELEGNFTDKIWALDNVRYYRPDPLAPGATEHPAEPLAPQAEVEP